MAPRRRVARRGRTVIALALVAFVVLASGVIWRRAEGVAKARELRAMQQRLVRLRGERAQLVLEIRQAVSRGRLVPVAERRLGLRVPADSQIVILSRPARAP